MRKKQGMRRRTLAVAVAAACVVALMAGALSACSGAGGSSSGKEKVLNYGTTSTWSKENEDHGFDPHNSYWGWTTMRLGVGETLFKFDDNMQIQPWIASGYEQVSDTQVDVTIKDNVTFSNGKKVDAAAVKACFEDLLANHDRAPSDLEIASMEANGQVLTITTKKPNPALLYYLSDPYGCIIDMDSDHNENTVVGTGPYTVESTTDDTVTLAANKSYWDGNVNVDKVVAHNITDGDTLTMALQNGEIDAAYGLPYDSRDLFVNGYNTSAVATSRVYEVAFNYHKDVMKDAAVRKAICMSLNSEDFVNALLGGHGETAVGPFPANFTFAVDPSYAVSYDPDGAKEVLAQDGWKDEDGDGYLEKGGKKLEIDWVTYPSRQELPKLAEYAQEQLKNIGIKVNVNSTANHKDLVKSDNFDVYASAIVSAPQGDPQYYFTTQYLPESSYDAGHYSSSEVTDLISKLSTTFDADERADLAKQIQQKVLADNGYYYASFLQMAIVSKDNVTGLDAHPCDYYEINANMDIKG
jgi:peptide/nickel transport system substrate-binding protein